MTQKAWTYRQLIIEPTSAWITPLQADTIFGHLCWKMKQMGNGQKVNEFLEEMKKSPIFTLSDALPYVGFTKKDSENKRVLLKDKSVSMIYRPFLAHDNVLEEVEKNETSKKLSAIKTISKFNFIPADNLFAFASANTLNQEKIIKERMQMEKFFTKQPKWKNQINRMSGKVQEERLYSLSETYLTQPCQENTDSTKKEHFLHILIKIDKSKEDQFDNYFQIPECIDRVFTEGFGKKKSTGYGRFKKVELVSGWNFLREDEIAQAGSNRFVLQSHFVPATTDPTNGRYSVSVKYGKMGEERAISNPHKKPLLRLNPGATFAYDADVYKGYVGRMVDGLSDAHEDAVQYGYGLTIEF